jgi:hypothetical protein
MDQGRYYFSDFSAMIQQQSYCSYALRTNRSAERSVSILNNKEPRSEQEQEQYQQQGERVRRSPQHMIPRRDMSAMHQQQLCHLQVTIEACLMKGR